MNNENVVAGHQDPSEQYRTDTSVETSSQPEPASEEGVQEAAEGDQTVTPSSPEVEEVPQPESDEAAGTPIAPDAPSTEVVAPNESAEPRTER